MKRETITTGNHVGLISSLPKWASQEIHRLDREVAALRDKLYRARSAYDIDNNEFVVPVKTRIRSTVDVSSFDRLYLDFEEDGSLNVQLMGLVVIPAASNRITIRQREDLTP